MMYVLSYSVCLVLEDEVSHGTSRVDRGGVLGEKDDS